MPHGRPMIGGVRLPRRSPGFWSWTTLLKPKNLEAPELTAGNPPELLCHCSACTGTP